MQRKMMVGSASLLVLMILGLMAATPAAAFHGAWWRGFGTATGPGGQSYGVDFTWGGQTAVVTCGGGGCLGVGTGKIVLTGVGGLATLTIPFAGVEDVRNIFFSADATWCASSMEVTPNYLLTYTGGTLSGIQRNCLSTGINKNDFTGTFGDLSLTIHAEGPFGVSHG